MFNCKLYCYTLAKLRFISLACSKIDANQANKLCKRLHSGALHNERNITLVAPRRMGKTGLIHHVFHQMEEQYAEVKCFYFDI